MTGPGSDWLAFERHVADLFRQLGADVVHDEFVAGSQSDVVVVERTASGGQIRTIIDCKAYRHPVGVDDVRRFDKLKDGLVRRGRVDRAVMVATNGYTKPARLEAENAVIELLEVADLEQRVRRSPKAVSQDARDVVGNISAICGVVREQLRSPEPLTLFDFDGMHSDLSKILDDLHRALRAYPVAAGLSTAQRRVRGVLARIEDELERAGDAVAYWRRLVADLAERDAGFPDTQVTADVTSARLMLLREQEQARQMLRNRLRAVEDGCARAPWNNTLD